MSAGPSFSERTLLAQDIARRIGLTANGMEDPGGFLAMVLQEFEKLPGAPVHFAVRDLRGLGAGDPAELQDRLVTLAGDFESEEADAAIDEALNDAFGAPERKPFYSNCVDWPDDVDLLVLLQDEAEEIERKEFLRLVDKETMRDIEAMLGYNRHLTMAGDRYVSYHLEPKTGIPFFQHSRVEHVFATEQDIEALAKMHMEMEEAALEVDGEFEP